MSETKKLAKEELDMIDQLRADTQQKIMQFGEVELEFIYLEKRKEQLQELKETFKKELDEIQNKEAEFSRSLETKYGQGTLNLQNGEFVSV